IFENREKPEIGALRMQKWKDGIRYREGKENNPSGHRYIMLFKFVCEVKSKKRKRENGDKEEKKSKKASEKESNKNEDNVWELGNNRQVSVRDFKGKLYVDIREMYMDKELNLKPGKK
ncbi:unnamed protein product, partial [Heterotrigona itama]